MAPLAIDLFCGLGGWSEAFIAEGYRVVGFDITRHQYWMPGVSDSGDGHKHTKPIEKRGWTQGCAVSLGMEGPNANAQRKLVSYPGQLVLQDILTIHGSQLKDAAVIVASPPCQKYSYLAMPRSRSPDFARPSGDGWEILNSVAAKELREQWGREGPDNRLFDACFRIQREAIEATRRDCVFCDGTGLDRDEPQIHIRCKSCGGAGYTERYIPLIVENVRGAIPWVGRSAWNYGSFHLWGDVPALMPFSGKILKGKTNFHFHEKTGLPSPSWHGGEHEASVARALSVHALASQKIPAYSDPRRNSGKGVHLTSPHENAEGTKISGDWFSDPNSTCRKHGSRSNARKAASAQIAKIPYPLAEHIAKVYKPRESK